jgi:DNA-binding NarL/FixJ family response regulator
MIRVLIADDSVVVRERLAEMVSELKGVELVGKAEDAIEARSLAEKLRPDVAILDVRMPGGSGVDVLHDIKRQNPRTKVIMLTAYPHPEVRNKCVQGGADYFLETSTEFARVLAILDDCLSRSAARGTGLA